jgi:hypothetical protein
MARKVLMAFIVVAFMLAGVFWALAAPPQWLKGTPEEKFKALQDIQEALGSVMIEYNYRITTMFFAAKGGNWDLASYELKEAKEIQEVGETTRPQFAPALKAFEQAYLDGKIEPALKAKSFAKFSKAFDDMANGCNACHAAQKMPYIHYVRPKHPVAALKYTP